MNNKKPAFPPWDSSITLEPGKSINMTEDVASDYELQRKGLREIRGNVIARTIEIEFALDKLITDLFYQGIKDEKLKNAFHLIIPEQSRLALSKKIEFLERFANLFEYKLELIDINKDLKGVSEARNDFVHCIITFHPNEEANKLLPFMHTKGEKIALGKNNFDRLNQLFGSIGNKIEAIIKKLTNFDSDGKNEKTN